MFKFEPLIKKTNSTNNATTEKSPSLCAKQVIDLRQKHKELILDWRMVRLTTTCRIDEMITWKVRHFLDLHLHTRFTDCTVGEHHKIPGSCMRNYTPIMHFVLY